MSVRITVQLSVRSHEALAATAVRHKITKEEAFSYLLRNGVGMSAAAELGMVMLVDPMGNISIIPGATPIETKPKRRKRPSKPTKPAVRLESTSFSADVDNETAAQLELISQVMSDTQTDTINRLIQMANRLDRLLREGYCAWGRDSQGRGTGRIIFTM